MKYSEKLRIIEEIAGTPVYYPLGFAKDKLIILSNMEGMLSLWSIDPRTGEKEKLVSVPVTGAAKPVEKNGLIIYTKDVSKGKELSRVYYLYIDERKEYQASEIPPQRIIGVAADTEKIVFSGSLENKIVLNMISLETGEQKIIYEDTRPFFVSDVEDTIVVGSGHFTDDPRAMELFLFDLTKREMKIYTPKKGSVNEAGEIREGRLLYFTNAYGKKKILIHNINEERDVEPDFTYDDYKKENYQDYAGTGWTIDGRIWFIGKNNGRTTAYLDGKRLELPEGFVNGFVPHNNNLYFGHSSLTQPPRLYEYNLLNKELRLLLDSTLPKDIIKKLGRTEFITYKSYDGLEIPAFVALPKNAEEPGPTIIYVHGGPWSEVADSWNRFIASLVATGYNVIAPNFRGSTGYGERFRLLDIGDPGGGDFQDIIHARKYVIEKGIASRTAIIGYSYGGFMTYLALTKEPDLWTAGVAGAGIVDWEEMYELSDQVFKNFMNILFAGKKELWKDRSAIHFVDNLKAPICIIHPQNDTRTPLKPILKFINKLVEREKTFEAHIIPDMGHFLGKTEDAVKIIYPTITFLDKYVK